MDRWGQLTCEDQLMHQLWVGNQQKWSQSLAKQNYMQLHTICKSKIDKAKVNLLVTLSKHNYELSVNQKWTEVRSLCFWRLETQSHTFWKLKMSVCLQSSLLTITHILWFKKWMQLKSVWLWRSPNIIYTHPVESKINRNEKSACQDQQHKYSHTMSRNEISLHTKVSKQNYAHSECRTWTNVKDEVSSLARSANTVTHILWVKNKYTRSICLQRQLRTDYESQMIGDEVSMLACKGQQTQIHTSCKLKMDKDQIGQKTPLRTTCE